MQPTVGEIYEGKVTGITKFGAFVALPEGRSGLVHISEIANSYVNDIHDYLTEGQTVKVKLVAIGDDGKLNFSIKKAVEPPPRPPQPSFKPARPAVTAESSFEDKLKQFMQESDSKISSSKLYAEKKNTSRRRRD